MIWHLSKSFQKQRTKDHERETVRRSKRTSLENDPWAHLSIYRCDKHWHTEARTLSLRVTWKFKVDAQLLRSSLSSRTDQCSTTGWWWHGLSVNSRDGMNGSMEWAPPRCFLHLLPCWAFVSATLLRARWSHCPARCSHGSVMIFLEMPLVCSQSKPKASP